MYRLNQLRKEREPISVAIIGAGLMGRGLFALLKNLDGFDPVFFSSRNYHKLEEAFLSVASEEDKISFPEEYERGKTLLTTDNSLSWKWNQIDVIVDCTGNTVAGAEIAYEGITHKKHIVSLNVECDVLLGRFFYELARENDVVYTLTAGDEPGSIMELYYQAESMGFEILAAGKGKNNPVNRDVTPEELREEAEKKGLNPRMLTSFVDATNTMIELNAVANATGFIPDLPGCRGIMATQEDVLRKFALIEEGGEFIQDKVVDYVEGMAPGVFLIVRATHPILRDEMEFLKMGSGDRFLLYRPYHLTNLETPISILRAVIDGEETMVPLKRKVAETVAVAKRDIKAGETIEGIGSSDTYGLLVTTDEAKDGVPIGLLNENSVAVVDIFKGDMVKYGQVQLEDNFLTNLFKDGKK